MNAFTGTGALVRFILRRDRVALPIWVLLFPLLAVSFAASYARLYPTPTALHGFADEVAGSPAEIAMLGNVFAPTLGGLTAWRWSMATAILIGVASFLTVIRHTRTEEEKGRLELLGATVVGRHAPLSAALIVTYGADLLVGILTTVALISLGLPVTGSVALGLSAAAVGWLFAAIAGVTAQLAQTAGAAKGLAAVILGVSYLMRAIGEAGAQSGITWLTWLSPLGWMRSIRPFANEQWGIFALFIVSAGASVIAAFALSAWRDLGAGLLPPRIGPALASAGLNSPLALAWRLHRGMLLAWSAAFLFIGIIFGYIARTATLQLTANPQLQEYFAQLGGQGGASDGLFTLALMIFIEVVAAYAILATLRLRAEEVEMRADPVLAVAVSRIRWATSHLVYAAIGPVALLAAFGLAAGLTYGLSAGNIGYELPRILAAALAYVPAVWVLSGITALLFGLLPRYAGFLSWIALGMCIVIDLGGELQLLNQAMLNLSPFTHVPKILVGQTSMLPLVWLLAIAAALTIAGLVSFRRRDVL